MNYEEIIRRTLLPLHIILIRIKVNFNLKTHPDEAPPAIAQFQLNQNIYREKDLLDR